MTPEPPRRRAYEQTTAIDAATQVAVDQGDRETRHELRNEFTLALVGVTNQITDLAKQLADSNLREVQDHAEFRAQLAELERSVKTLQPLEDRVDDLEGHERSDLAVAGALAGVRRGLMWLAGWIVAVAGVLIAVLRA